MKPQVRTTFPLIAGTVGAEDRVTAYGWKALAGSVIGYAMDGFDMLILGFMLAARINATIPATQAKMEELGKVYEPHIFEGAGHGFLMRQGDQNGANLKASEQAWPITIRFLKKHTESRPS